MSKAPVGLRNSAAGTPIPHPFFNKYDARKPLKFVLHQSSKMMISAVPILIITFVLSEARIKLENESNDLNRQLVGIDSGDELLIAPVVAPFDRKLDLNSIKGMANTRHTGELTSTVTLPLKLIERMMEQSLLSLKQVNNLLNKILSSTLQRVG